MGLHQAFRRWILPVVLLTAGLLIAAGGAGTRLALRYDRAAIEAAEFFRLVSGHFAHLGWSHFALNAAGILLVWVLVGGAFSPLQWLIAVAVILAGIDIGFWLLLPELQWYVGLSGLLHGLLAAGAVGQFSARRNESIAILVILALKLGYEAAAGALPGTSGAAGGPVVTEAHLYGAISGLLIGALLSIGNRARAPI